MSAKNNSTKVTKEGDTRSPKNVEGKGAPYSCSRRDRHRYKKPNVPRPKFEESTDPEEEYRIKVLNQASVSSSNHLQNFATAALNADLPPCLAAQYSMNACLLYPKKSDDNRLPPVSSQTSSVRCPHCAMSWTRARSFRLEIVQGKNGQRFLRLSCCVSKTGRYFALIKKVQSICESCGFRVSCEMTNAEESFGTGSIKKKSTDTSTSRSLFTGKGDDGLNTSRLSMLMELEEREKKNSSSLGGFLQACLSDSTDIPVFTPPKKASKASSTTKLFTSTPNSVKRKERDVKRSKLMNFFAQQDSKK